MADITSGITIYEQDTGVSIATDSPYEYKEIMVETESTVDDTDTFTVTLANYGITNIKTIKSFNHTTNGSVIVVEDPTTSVTTGVLTVTVGGSTDNLKRVVIIGGY